MTYKKITGKIWDDKRNIPNCPAKGAFEIVYRENIFFIVDGELHREGGPARISSDGTWYYCQNGELHRVDGPAVVYPNGTKFYYQNNMRHRTDGPATIWSSGTEYYWLFGQEYTKEDWEPLAIQLSLKEQIV